MPHPSAFGRFKALPFTNPATGTSSWRITGTKQDGTRIRRNFEDRLTALQALADLEEECKGRPETSKMQRTRLNGDQLADAEAAARAADGRGITELVGHYLALEARANAKNVDLDSAMLFVEAHYRNEISPITILNAYDEFLASRDGGAAATTSYYETTLRRLLEHDPNKYVHAFTVSDIEKVLAAYKNLSSKRTMRGSFSTFFGWAVRHHYCLENPCDRLDKLQRDMSQIASLTLDESKRMLYAAMTYQGGAAAAAIAIGMFAGLRPSELRDLKPTDIHKDKIRVTGGKLRRTLKRSVPMPPVLIEWLKQYPFESLPAGWDSKMKYLKSAVNATNWVQNIVRHTSITFQAERDKNEALTAFNCGTSIQMMNRHYRHTIDDDQSVDEFWDLTPQNVLAEEPKIGLPRSKRIQWPEKKLLTKLVWEKPLSHAAKDLGVSDAGLRKRCLKLGIALPMLGHWLRKSHEK